MIALWRFRTILASLAILAATLGCRKAEPPMAYNRDLGDDGTTLLPVASPWKETALKDGRADWHPFREPGAEEPQAAETTEEPPAGDAGETEAEVRDLIAEYNELIDGAAVDDLMEFFASDQRDALKPAIESALAANEKLSKVTAALEAQLPDAGDRIANAAKTVRMRAGVGLSIESITVVSEDEATAKLAGGFAPGCTLRLLDDVWYIALAGAPDFADLKQSTSAFAQTCDTWLTSLESDEAAAETVLSQMEQPAPVADEDTAEAPAEPDEAAEEAAEVEEEQGKAADVEDDED